MQRISVTKPKISGTPTGEKLYKLAQLEPFACILPAFNRCKMAFADINLLHSVSFVYFMLFLCSIMPAESILKMFQYSVFGFFLDTLGNKQNTLSEALIKCQQLKHLNVTY